jgi:sugar phosphate isomerase/epimerase
VDLAADVDAVIVLGSLQGRAKDEPVKKAGSQRIDAALGTLTEYASGKKVTIAVEPVNHIEVGWHNTIAEVSALVRALAFPCAQMMVDTFHMNIEEKEMFAPLSEVIDILAHVHLSETNRDVLGSGHWDTACFLNELKRLRYNGYCSVGVYNTCMSREACIRTSMKYLNTVSS